MNFIDAYKYSIINLKTFSLKSLKEIANKNNIPFIDKNQIINLLAYELLLPYFQKSGNMKPEKYNEIIWFIENFYQFRHLLIQRLQKLLVVVPVGRS